MPSAAAMLRSRGVVMKPRTRSAFAPTYAVVTVTVALCSLGYSRTLSEPMAWRPPIKITRLTTMAKTGRFTKMSVKLLMGPSSSGYFAVFGLGVQVGVDGDFIVGGGRRAVGQLERARHDPRLSPGEALGDLDKISA